MQTEMQTDIERYILDRLSYVAVLASLDRYVHIVLASSDSGRKMFTPSATHLT
jgi:hypothetical protein